MNKYSLLILICLSQASSLHAQNPNFPAKYDAIWLSGYSNASDDDRFGGMKIDFNNYPPTIETEDRMTDFDIVIGITCYEMGELQCYTTGEYFADKHDNIIENGDDLNPDTSVDQKIGYQKIISLPFYEKPGEYFFIHKETKWLLDSEGTTMDGFWTQNVKTYYSIVDMNLNNGLGKVTEKNVEIINDTLNFGLVTAVKHANGRDWWMLLPEYWSNNYYRYLITPNGIDTLAQQVTETDEGLLPALGQAVFSPDGSKYIVTGSSGIDPDSVYLDIYDFDRCEGLLSNRRRKDFPEFSFGKPVAVSPNSRYLYFYVNQTYYQYDLQADDILASEVIIGEYDGFELPINIGSYPFLSQIGLDGKIYYSTTSTTFVMHVIHDPDFPAESSRFEQHGIILPRLNNGTIANHPNYRLGPLDGGSCDTLGLDNLPVANFRAEIFSDTVHLRDLSAGAPTDWYWTFGDGNTSYEKHNNHIYEAGGLYEVCLTVSNANGSDTWCDNVQVITTDVTGEQHIRLKSSLFPNPSDGLVMLQSAQNLPASCLFEVCDQTGRVLLRNELQAGVAKQNINLQDLPNGLYFYKIVFEDFVIGQGKAVIAR